MQIFLSLVIFNGLLLSRNAFIFPNVYHRNLVFVTSKVREVFQALPGEGIRFNGPQSRVNKIGL